MCRATKVAWCSATEATTRAPFGPGLSDHLWTPGSVQDTTSEAKAEARKRFLDPFHDHLLDAGLGHISEIADAEPPHTPHGCPFQAWSIGELIRLESTLLR
jgi:hypothetical protein